MTLTIKTIAKKAGVSVATVSYVLNNSKRVSPETREHVLRVIDELNYKPNRIAKSLRVNKTNTIGVLVEDITVFHTPQIVNGINEFAENNGYHIILSDLCLNNKINNIFERLVLYKDKIADAVDLLCSAQVDGIIYVGLHDRSLDGIVKNLRKPIVYTYCYTGNPDDISVTYDNQAIFYEATQYLIDMGHKKIAVISGPVDSVPSHKRMMGYQTALMDNSLPFDVRYIKIGNWEYDFGFKMCNELMEMNDPPTAIFAMNDIMALGAMEAAFQKGISVPDDLSIIGFDNRECSFYSNPKLTTIELPLKQMGYTAAMNLDKVLKGEKLEKNTTILSCKLLKRNSVCCVKTKTNNCI